MLFCVRDSRKTASFATFKFWRSLYSDCPRQRRLRIQRYRGSKLCGFSQRYHPWLHGSQHEYRLGSRRTRHSTAKALHRGDSGGAAQHRSACITSLRSVLLIPVRVITGEHQRRQCMDRVRERSKQRAVGNFPRPAIANDAARNPEQSPIRRRGGG